MVSPFSAHFSPDFSQFHFVASQNPRLPASSIPNFGPRPTSALEPSVIADSPYRRPIAKANNNRRFLPTHTHTRANTRHSSRLRISSAGPVRRCVTLERSGKMLGPSWRSSPGSITTQTGRAPWSDVANEGRLTARYGDVPLGFVGWSGFVCRKKASFAANGLLEEGGGVEKRVGFYI